jgi:hypothetical protein
MRRSLVVLAVIALVASLPGLAEAESLKVRLDPNDSPLNTDIRRVVTDLTDDTVYLRIDSWQRLRPWSVDGEYIVRLDTSGNRYFDRVVEIYAGRDGFTCLVEVSARSGDPGAVVGDLRASRPSGRSVACSLPRSWFPRIHRAVRFVVSAEKDQAPNRGMFVWL